MLSILVKIIVILGMLPCLMSSEFRGELLVEGLHTGLSAGSLTSLQVEVNVIENSARQGNSCIESLIVLNGDRAELKQWYDCSSIKGFSMGKTISSAEKYLDMELRNLGLPKVSGLSTSQFWSWSISGATVNCSVAVVGNFERIYIIMQIIN